MADFSERLAEAGMAALWERMSTLVTPEPKTPCLPVHWRYADVRRLLAEAGERVTAEEAERRVLILENPGLPGESAATHSLYAGIQLVLPGEVAPQHRHTQAALRFIIESADAFTTVGGERLLMQPGDLVLTPAWEWHDHGNDTDQPAVWLDGLDVPLVGMLDASFAERAQAPQQIVERPLGDGLARFGQTLAPISGARPSLSSPLRHYPYGQARAAVRAVAEAGLDPSHGARLRYLHPLTGDWVLPTMGASIQHLPKRFRSEPYRSTDATVVLVAEGEGVAEVGERSFDLAKGDVFVVPSWVWRTFEARDDLVLLGFSDRPVQEKLGLWREQTHKEFVQ